LLISTSIQSSASPILTTPICPTSTRRCQVMTHLSEAQNQRQPGSLPSSEGPGARHLPPANFFLARLPEAQHHRGKGRFRIPIKGTSRLRKGLIGSLKRGKGPESRKRKASGMGLSLGLGKSSPFLPLTGCSAVAEDERVEGAPLPPRCSLFPLPSSPLPFKASKKNSSWKQA
jgi:hypothetical protein